MLTRDRARSRGARRLSGLGQVEAESLIENLPAGAGETVPSKQFNETVLQEFFKNPEFKELFDLSAEFMQRAVALEGALKTIQQQSDAGIISIATHSSQAATARGLIGQYNSKAGEINRFLTRAHADTRGKTAEILTEKGYSVDPSLFAGTSGLGAVLVIAILALVKIALIGAAIVAGTLGAASLVSSFREDKVGLAKAQKELADTILAQTPEADKGRVAKILAGKVPDEGEGLLIVVGIVAAIAAAIAILK